MVAMARCEAGIWHFEGSRGEDAQAAVGLVIEKLKKHNQSPSGYRDRRVATLTLSGVTMDITEKSTVKDVLNLYKRNLVNRATHGAKRPDGVTEEEHALSLRMDAQDRCDTVMYNLPLYIAQFQQQKAEGHRQPHSELATKVFTLLRIACDSAEHDGVKFDKKLFASYLKALGYERNEIAGPVAMTENRQMHRAYVAGKIIDCTEEQGPMPPCAVMKIKQYGLDTQA